MIYARPTYLVSWLIASVSACQSTQIPAPQSQAAAAPPPAATPAPITDPLASVPEASYVPPQPFPKISVDSFDNGLELDIIERQTLPVANVELTILSGTAAEGDRAGAARVTAEWLEAGGAGRWSSRQLRESVDALGSSLEINVTRDAIRIGLAVTTDHLDEALEILAALVMSPRFDRVEFNKLKQRESERVQSAARTSGNWMAQMLLHRQLYQLPIGIHPYASYDVLPTELERLTPQICRAWFKDFVTPRNSQISLVGAVDPSTARARVARHFSHWKGPETPGFSPSEPEGINQFTIHVVDRPHSTQSDIFLAFLGPNRRDTDFPLAAIAQQIVGGGVAGRLFADVREKRSLAYATGAGIQEVKVGPSVLYFSVGTQTAKTAEAVGALLEHLDLMAKGQFSPNEIERAQHFLVDSMPIRWEQVQTLGSQLTQLRVLALPNDYYDTYRDQVMRSSADDIARFTAGHYAREHSVMVIAGDSNKVAPELTKYATVSIVDPSQGFRVRSQLKRTAGQ